MGLRVDVLLDAHVGGEWAAVEAFSLAARVGGESEAAEDAW